jgi:hypothetical protein
MVSDIGHKVDVHHVFFLHLAVGVRYERFNSGALVSKSPQYFENT